MFLPKQVNHSVIACADCDSARTHPRMLHQATACSLPTPPSTKFQIIPNGTSTIMPPMGATHRRCCGQGFAPCSDGRHPYISSLPTVSFLTASLPPPAIIMPSIYASTFFRLHSMCRPARPISTGDNAFFCHSAPGISEPVTNMVFGLAEAVRVSFSNVRFTGVVTISKPCAPIALLPCAPFTLFSATILR